MIVLAGMIGALLLGMVSIITTIIVGYGFGVTTDPEGTVIAAWVFPSAFGFWFFLAGLLLWREDNKIQKLQRSWSVKPDKVGNQVKLKPKGKYEKCEYECYEDEYCEDDYS